MLMKPCLAVDLGVIAYGRALELQRRLVEARKAGAAPDVLLLCEHPHVITLGRSGHREHLRVSDGLLRARGVEFHATDRGGDITYHGPGQQVGYPILHVGELRRDVVWYVRQMEEALIRAAGDFGVTARREPGLTGVWVDPPAAPERGATGDAAGRKVQARRSDAKGRGAQAKACATSRGPEKLAAIGVHFSRWVSSHGFAFNVSTELLYFDWIVPCGIRDRGVTSLQRLLGRRVDLGEFRLRLIERFGEVYGFDMQAASPEQLEQQLEWAGVAPARVAAGT